jgi:iron complex outermembrane recepter protein
MNHRASRRRVGQWIAAVTSALGSLGWAGSLLAAEIPEIIVSTERREANLQTVPVAVSALDVATIADRQVTSYQDLQRFVPSLKMTNNITSPTNLSPSLRGSLQQDASLIVAESPFGIYVDDVYVGRLNGNNISLNDIERVEVLRGPQGTLYGRNTLAGAIKFVSRTPGKDNSWFEASAGAGNFDQYFAKATVGGPIAGDFAGSIAAQYNSKDGEFNNVGNFNKGKVLSPQATDYQRNMAVRGKLRYMGWQNFDALLSLSYVDSQNDALQLINGTTPGVPTTRQFTSHDIKPTFGFYNVSTPTLAAAGPGPVRRDPGAETKQLITSLNASYDFGAFTLKSITAFVNLKDRFSTDFSGVGTIIGASTVDDDQVTEELQILGKALDDRLSYLGGVYFLHETGDQQFGWYFFGPVSTSQFKLETNSISFYGQADYKIFGGLKATAGARWVHDHKAFDLDFQSPPAPAATTTQISLRNGYSAFTPKVGLDYTFDSFSVFDDLMTYVSAARGFKSGGYSAIVIFGANDAKTPYFPEKNWTFEAGFKSDAFSRRVRFNANYFWERIENLALNATVTIPNPNPPPATISSFPVQNAGSAYVHGVEFELTVVPIENLTLYLNAAFEHGYFGALNATSAPAQAKANFGVDARPPQLPSVAFTIGADYAIPVSLGETSGMVHVGGDWFDSSSYVTAATNDYVNSPYDRLALYTGLDIGSHWNLKFAMKNVRDTHDITSGSRALGGFIILPQREWTFAVNYKM